MKSKKPAPTPIAKLPGPPWTCLIYARVSSEEQREKQTIDSQLAILPAYAQTMGWPIGGIYKDDGYSGETIEDRPDFVKLLAAMENGLGNLVLTIDYDRVTRSQSDEIRGRISDTFRRTGVAWTSPTTGIRDFSDDSQRIVMGVEGAMSATEKAKFLRRTSRGKRYWALQGKFRAGLDPYGYRWVPAPNGSKGGHYELREDEAKVVRRMYQLALTMGVNMVAWTLNQEGYKTRPMKRGSRPHGGPGAWARTTVSKVLKSTTYRGGKSVFEGQAVPGIPDAVIEKMPVPALIDPDTWNQVQKVLSQRKPVTKYTHERQYLLSGFVKCGVCGYACWVVNARPHHHSSYAYYRCSSTNAWRSMPGMDGPCGLPHMRVEEIDRNVWDRVVTVLGDPNLLEAACSIDNAEPAGVDWQKELEKLVKKLRRLERHEGEVLAGRRRGTISKSAYEKEMREIVRDRDMIERNKRIAEQQLESASMKRKAASNIRAIAAELVLVGQQAEFEERQRVLRLLLSTQVGGKVILNKDGSVSLYGGLPVGDSAIDLQLTTAPTAG